MRALHRREADEIDRRFPKLLRRVGGYNIDMIDDAGHNMAHLLVGSEGTLGFFAEIELDLQPIPSHRVLGICHFPSFYKAMEAAQHVVKLGPTAVELVDRTMIELAWATMPRSSARSSSALSGATPTRSCCANSPAMMPTTTCGASASSSN